MTTGCGVPYCGTPVTTIGWLGAAGLMYTPRYVRACFGLHVCVHAVQSWKVAPL